MVGEYSKQAGGFTLILNNLQRCMTILITLAIVGPVETEAESNGT